MDTWEFFCACHSAPKAIWTRWRWRRVLHDGKSVEGTTDSVTLPQCKAEAAQHGFCMDYDVFSIVTAPYMGLERRTVAR